MKKYMKLCKAVQLLSFALLLPSCVLLPKSKNEYKHLKGREVQLKQDQALYRSRYELHSETYYIDSVGLRPAQKTWFLAKGTKLYIENIKHLRSLDHDLWYGTGHVYVDGLRRQFACRNLSRVKIINPQTSQ